MNELLRVESLSVRYRRTPVLTEVSLRIGRGQVVGLTGESGSGKSSLAHALLGVADGATVSGQVWLDGTALPVDRPEELDGVRWNRIALAFQYGVSGLDPVRTVLAQIAEPLRIRRGLSRASATERARELWNEVGLPPERAAEAYPHQLSGGQARRAMIALALCCDPDLLIADEPTAGLDPTQRLDVLRLLRRRRDRGTAMLLISHDLSDLAELADQICVLHQGRIIEQGPAHEVLDDPRHPYTVELVDAYPRLDRARDLGGRVAEATGAVSGGCAYRARCPQAVGRCATDVPVLTPVDGRALACHLGGIRTVIEATGLGRSFGPVTALDSVSLSVRAGQTLAVIGASGSGKSTLARCLAGQLSPDTGTVLLAGEPVGAGRGGGPHRRLQLVQQNPYDAVSPRFTVRQVVREPLDIARSGTPAERDEAARRALDLVGLPTDETFGAQFAHQLSGGQLQRVALARALVVEPLVLIADEPTAMLDSAAQSRLLRVLRDLQDRIGLALVLVSHDLALVRKIAHTIVVLDSGRCVEHGPAHRIVTDPQHPTTRALLRSARGSLRGDARGTERRNPVHAT
ncbi:dipeptide ABC transporter ATP-binding protein [Pseudonocardia hispaniensis]|uniref:Dipeptide ABC transporter ATP-binding protein n=1 Tax=Pseudonocardia hispaniensis TaxID=904933 RepID=A0ABW1IYM3_9PSEU